jgi:hypothetical protein
MAAFVGLLVGAWALGYCAGAGLKYYERFTEKAVQ